MRLIYAQSEVRANRGEWNTLFGWLQVIPEETLRSHPRLYSQYANVLITLGKTEAGDAALSYLEKAAQADAGLQGEVALFQAILARRRGDVPRWAELCQKALSLLPPDKLSYRARASFFLGGIATGRAHLDEAWRLQTDAFEMARQAADYWIWAGAAGALGWILWLRGRLRQALEASRQAVDLAGNSPAAAPPR